MSLVSTRPAGANGDALSLEDDILVGVEDIAVFIYGLERGKEPRNLRRTYAAVAKGDLPTFRLAGKIHALKSAIRQRIAASEEA
jgi:hypothetical protein